MSPNQPTHDTHDNAVDLAQNLMGHIDSSAGNFTQLADAVNTAIETGKFEGSNVDTTDLACHIASADANLTRAWRRLEEGSETYDASQEASEQSIDHAPLLSETFIAWSGDPDDEPHFRDDHQTTARTRLREIAVQIEVAAQDIDDAYTLMTDAETTITAAEVDADFGAYDTLEAFLKYVRSDVFGMRDLAYRAANAA